MRRIFATVTEDDDDEIELAFETITQRDLINPKNLGVSAESIVMVRQMGYKSVKEFWEDVGEDYAEIELEPGEKLSDYVEDIEESIESEYTDNDYAYRTYAEYGRD